MIGGLAEATPYFIVLVGCGLVWFVVSRQVDLRCSAQATGIARTGLDRSSSLAYSRFVPITASG